MSHITRKSIFGDFWPGKIQRLICAFVVRIWHKTRFRMTWPKWCSGLTSFMKFYFSKVFLIFELSVFAITIYRYFDLLSRKILLWHSKSYFDIHTESENPILIFCLISYFSDSVRMSKYDFEYRNMIFRLSANVKIGFWMSKYDFPTQFECQKGFRISK